MTSNSQECKHSDVFNAQLPLSTIQWRCTKCGRLREESVDEALGRATARTEG